MPQGAGQKIMLGVQNVLLRWKEQGGCLLFLLWAVAAPGNGHTGTHSSAAGGQCVQC